MKVEYTEPLKLKNFIEKHKIKHVGGRMPGPYQEGSLRFQFVYYSNTNEIRLWWGWGNVPSDCTLICDQIYIFPEQKQAIEVELGLLSNVEHEISKNYTI